MAPDMTTPPQSGKQRQRGTQPPPSEAARHPFGPRPIGALLPAVTRPAFRKQSPAAAGLMTDWPAIVGPALAQTTRPKRLAAGTLTLGCAGPIALELQHLAGPLMERINTHLGRPLVQRLRFVQEALAPPPVPRRKPRLDPVPIEGMPAGDLNDALAALGAAVSTDRA